jgi:malic enzyme
MTAAHTLAELAGPDDLVPNALDVSVHNKIASAVADMIRAGKSGQ